MEKDSGKIFNELKKDISTYVELKLELLKLGTYERTGKVIAVLSFGLILMFMAFFTILFIFLALGFFLGEQLGSSSAGFGIVAALYLLILGIVLLNKNKIRVNILNVIIAALMANDDKEDVSNKQQHTDAPGETDF